MSVTTSSRINLDQLIADLPAGTSITWTGPPLEAVGTKVITPVGTTDAILQTAVTAAAASFVDLQANLQSLLQKAQTALTANQTYLGIASPSNAQVVAQVAALTRQVNALIRMAANQLSSTTGT